MNELIVTKKIPVRCTVIDTDMKQIRSHTYEIKYGLKTEAQEGEDYNTAYIHQNMSFQIANAFLWDQLHQSIIYDFEGKELAEKNFCEFDNNFMFLPNISEATLVSALHCKLNAIIHENSIVDVISIKDTVDDLDYNFVNTDFDYPMLMDIKDWLGELSFWDKPWWYRRDFSTFDNIALDQEELDTWKETKKEESNLRMQKAITDIEESVREQMTQATTDDKGILIEVDFSKKAPKPKLVPKNPDK
jgi:hypothetical protein